MNCLLIGNYGAGNLGDELLKEYFLRAFPQIQWTVLSASPSGGDLPRLPFGLRSVLTTRWWRTLTALSSCNAVVFGGGSLFTDSESVRACLLWWWHARVARFFGKPVLLAFQGIGPFRTRGGEWCARDVLRHAAFVSTRDAESAARVRVGDGVRVVESFDPVVLLFSQAPRSHQTDALGLIPRANSGAEFFAKAQEAMRSHPGAVRVIALQPEEERGVCDALVRMSAERATVHPVRSAQELLAALAPCSAVIAERYHGALAAIALGIPVTIVAQAAGDKLDALGTSGRTLAQLREQALEGERELLKKLSVL